MIYELREYTAAAGRGGDLHKRFQDHTIELFAAHQIELCHLWRDREDSDRVVYLLRFDDEDQRERAWSAFSADPRWRAVRAASEEPGRLVVAQRSQILQPVAYLPVGHCGSAQAEYRDGTIE